MHNRLFPHGRIYLTSTAPLLLTKCKGSRTVVASSCRARSGTAAAPRHIEFLPVKPSLWSVRKKHAVKSVLLIRSRFQPAQQPAVTVEAGAQPD